jgi:hypothetical protein
MAAKKPTFKKEPRATGLARIADPHPSTTIKLGGKRVGQIRPPHIRDEKPVWSVSVMVTTDKHPGWTWVVFARKHESESDARAWVLANWDKIAEKNSIHALED